MWEEIKTYYAMGEYCAREGSAYAPCREFFWLAGTFAATTLIAMAVLAFGYRRWRLHSMRVATRRLTLEHLESQAHIADEQTLQRFKWIGDDVATTKQESDLSIEIREGLQIRKTNG